MKNKLTLFLIVVSVLPLRTQAQESIERFSLKEAIEYALTHNRTVQNAARDIEAAEKQKWETTAIGLPQINATGDYQNALKQQVSLLPAEIMGGEPGTFIPVTFGTTHNVSATATLSQKVFDGSYLVGLQSAKVYLQISKNSKIKTDLEIRKAVINAYGNVLLSEESITILERNKKVLEGNLSETIKIYENGLEEEESVEQLQITLTGIESSLNNARRLNILAYQMLNITLGLDVSTPIELTDNLEKLTNQYIDPELLGAAESVEHTIDYQIADNDRMAKELLLKLEKSKSLPTLDAFINGGYNGFGNEFDFFKRSQKWFATSMFGLSLKVPIFSSLQRRAATQRAHINLRKAEANLTETEQQIRLEMATAKSDYRFAIEDYQNKKQNLLLAERIEQKNQTKFFEGIGSSFELRQAQMQLYTAQQELLQAMLDVISRKVELETVFNLTQMP